ncbi:MAG: hypothetical protein HY774_10990 [Acidobacteria bacterium]|nr:hypothetical protein [Acidobacteriota bacterium]
MDITIGEIIKNGVLFDMKNWEGKASSAHALPEIIEAFFNTLEAKKISFLLVGGVALLSYFEGRNTQDIDFIISTKDLNSLSEISIENRTETFVNGRFQGLKVDFLLTKNRLFNLIKKKYATVRYFGGKAIPCATVEGLLILKFYALPSLYRQGRLEKVSIYESDIEILLGKYGVELGKVFEILKKHLSESDFKEIQDIGNDIRRKIERFHSSNRRFKTEGEIIQ